MDIKQCGEPFLQSLAWWWFLGNENSVDVQTKMQMCAFQRTNSSLPSKKPIHFLSFPQNTMSLETGIKSDLLRMCNNVEKLTCIQSNLIFKPI